MKEKPKKMDDERFDELVKRYFKNYEHADPGLHAQEMFNQRLAALPKIPWYKTYKTETFVTSTFILFTLLNYLLMPGFTDSRTATLVDHDRLAKEKTIDSLNLIINQMRAKSLAPSVYFIDPSAMYPTRSEKLDTQQQDGAQTESNSGQDLSELDLGAVASIPKRILQRLSAEGMVRIEKGEAYLRLDNSTWHIRRDTILFESNTQLSGIHFINVPLSNKDKIDYMPHNSEANLNISVKLLNCLKANNYTRGIGLRLGGHFDLGTAIYTHGRGRAVPRVGLTADWIVSPHWSIETSLDYLSTSLTASNNFEPLDLPNLNSDLGSLERAKVSTRLVSFPFEIKYRWWLSPNHQLILKAGYTPYFFLLNQYLYQYPYPGQSPDPDLSISTLEQLDQNGFYTGTANLFVGITKLTKKKNQFECGMFYEKSLNKVNQKSIGMQLFGVRSSYSFKLN